MIVGGGIAGLSAAWKLRKSGITNFRVLELEDEAGGNSGWVPPNKYPKLKFLVDEWRTFLSQSSSLYCSC